MGVVYALVQGPEILESQTWESVWDSEDSKSCTVPFDLWDTVIALTLEDVRDPN